MHRLALSRSLACEDSTLPALRQALKERWNPSLRWVLIHHSDQGVQYATKSYVDCLGAHGIHVSMSRVGNPSENAHAESFFKTLKCEGVYLWQYDSAREAKERIRPFIEEVYTRKRLHSALGYRPSVEFETAIDSPYLGAHP